MRKYKIEISYQTGNSFGSSDEVDFLEYEWNNLDMAKESLSRIRNHHEYCEEYTGYNKPRVKLPKGVLWDNEGSCILLELVTDDGKPYIYQAFWIGYFEHLHSASIIYDDDDLVYIPK